MQRNSEINVPTVIHELSSHNIKLDILSEALTFLQEKGPGSKIVYIIDYSELNPYWNSQKPGKSQDLQKEGIQYIWNYLLGSERLFLELTDDPKEKLLYLQRSHDEQLEFIDALVFDNRFSTILLDSHQDYLKDDISYFAQWASKSLANRNYVISETETRLSQVSREALQHHSDLVDTFSEHVESFGFWSTNQEKYSRPIELIRNFVQKANFHLISDFPWTEYGISEKAQKRLWNVKSRKSDVEYWLKCINEGNDTYNEAFEQRGYWHRRQQGAEELAIITRIDRAIREQTNGNTRVAFVTRNHQFHCASMAAKNDPLETQPLILHPRLLSAFMIDQSAPRDADEKQTSAAKFDVNRIYESRKMIDISLSIARGGLKNRNQKGLQPGFRRFLNTTLRRSWDNFRRNFLSNQVINRIGSRTKIENSWVNRKQNKQISEFLKETVQKNFGALEIHKEIALLYFLPPENIWPKGTEFQGIRLSISTNEHSEPFVLFRTETFSHLFYFRSISIVTELREQFESGRTKIIDFGELLKSSYKKIQNLDEKIFHDEDNYIRNAMLYRFDRVEHLLLSAICLVSSNRFDIAAEYINSLDSIIKGEPNLEESIIPVLDEMEYLKLIVKRLEWRSEAHKNDLTFDDVNRIFDDANKTIKEILRTDKYRENKRISLLIVGFSRELFSFAHRHSLSRRKMPISVPNCLTRLEQIYELSIERKFPFTAARAQQQLNNFVRMYNFGSLPTSKALDRKLSNDFPFKTIEKMTNSLDELRSGDHLSTDDLPVTIQISEAVGKWNYRAKLGTPKDELMEGYETIVRLLPGIQEKDFADYLNNTVSDIEKYLKNGPS